MVQIQNILEVEISKFAHLKLFGEKSSSKHNYQVILLNFKYFAKFWDLKNLPIV